MGSPEEATLLHSLADAAQFFPAGLRQAKKDFYETLDIGCGTICRHRRRTGGKLPYRAIAFAKLDVWIDNIKGNTAQSWCANEVALRIVANGNKNVKILDNFLPRVGALMEHQCSRLQQLNWTLVDANNGHIARKRGENKNGR